MVMWRLEHDPFVTAVSVDCPAFQPIVFHPPNHFPSIHVAVYLPTQGQENEFISCISKLSLFLEEMQEKYPGAEMFLRGDFNVNENNIRRNRLLEHFCIDHLLKVVPNDHKTYHHFIGQGKSDSFLDKILHSSEKNVPEKISEIICKLENPLINSHHDLIISTFELPPSATEECSSNFLKAPRIPNNRKKVIWSDTGVLEYQKQVTDQLLRLQTLWLAQPSTRSCISLLMKSTNHVLTSVAAMTNKTINLNTSRCVKSRPLPIVLRKSQRSLLKMSKKIQNHSKIGTPQAVLADLKVKLKAMKAEHQRLVRTNNANNSLKRDQKLHSVLSTNPSSLYKAVNANKKSGGGRIQRLTVCNDLYLGDEVADGFYNSLKGLKTSDVKSLEASACYASFSEDYEHIIDICSNGDKIPQITLNKSKEILMKVKPGVSDLNSITAKHYLNAGETGAQHFHLLLSALISDINNTNIVEVNAVFATILYKGHGKDKHSDRSYRTISICPLLAKALDLYVRELNLTKWNQDQDKVQFMGEGSSHELAGLLLTEAVQFSLFTNKVPMFALFLDVRSAFDSVQRKILITKLFHCGTAGDALLFIDNRLGARTTYVEWEKILMGPIEDQLGVEQGGINSGEYYKIFGKEQLASAQSTKLGVRLWDQNVAAIGQADDTVIISNSLHSLQSLLSLTLAFCSKHQIQLCVEKTKLIAISTPAMSISVDHSKLTSPVNIDRNKVPFSTTVEHVGILRSEAGNLPHILGRLKAHQRALGQVLFTGAACHHRGNPAASLRVEKLYASPVLLKGLGALVLLKSEIDMVDMHLKKTHERLMRLHPRTPQCVTAFLGGSLPGTALVHQRILSLFTLVCFLKSNILHDHAKKVLTRSKPSSKSWFIIVRDLCLLYCLPHPLQLLNTNSSKNQLKNFIKKKIVDHWEQKLRKDAKALKSLQYFHPEYMSLTKPHPLWLTSGSSSYQVSMTTVQAIMLSGRYRTEQLCSRWSGRSPNCKLCKQNEPEDLHHILTVCDSLEPTRIQLSGFTNNLLLQCPEVTPVVLKYCVPTEPLFIQFLLDCSVLPEVIRLSQTYGSVIFHLLFRLTRTWCYVLHKTRLRLLNRWKKF